MMPNHDPSTCPCCCSLAEREGWIQREHELYLNNDGSPLLIWVDTNGTTYYAPPSSCTSVDAVAGLWAELVTATEAPEWWALERRETGWGFYKLRCLGSEHEFMHEVTRLEYLAPLDVPGQPIIEAAMRVLDDKESDVGS